MHAGSDEVGPAGAVVTVGGAVPAAATIATQLARVSAPKIQPPNAQPGMSSTSTGAMQPHIVAVVGIAPVVAAAVITSPQPSGICGIIGTKSATSHGVSAWRACRLWLAFATLPAMLALELAASRALLVTAAAGPTKRNRSAVAAVIAFRSRNDGGDGDARQRDLRSRLLPHSAIARHSATPTAWMLGNVGSVEGSA